ncbi:MULTISPECIES: SDR family NAD(P)-dependent oxidoreductase [Tsukamurella]|uniref:SDR family NAD(P)-dependent oxidoreductase n=1 Tax=Tsukamurella TaxID=2060 RepID=UPI002DD42D8A|nr:SDR family NAD(P)-dependent oxidoreductase [Tsukamurella tyrosinosolvens]MEC4614945.1 SDR family NAD(P)-dependent oxidoreductase [Tsukamurella tyrosinosolvens]
MKTVIVTGAAGGIGRETALLFAGRGNRVVAVDIDQLGAQTTAAEITVDGGIAVPYRLDVRDEEAWITFGQWIAGEFGCADVLVNNAGVMDLGGFVETDSAGWRRMVDVNLMSVIYGSKVFAQQMIDHGVRGHIVNISSAAAFLPSELDVAYAVSKAAVLMATQSLRTELKRQHIGVSAICPGAVRTDLLKNGRRNGLSDAELTAWNEGAGAAQTVFGLSGPDKVARRIVKAVEKNWAIVPVGPEAWFINFAYRASPAAVRGVSSIAKFTLMERLLDLGRPVLTRLSAGQSSR